MHPAKSVSYSMYTYKKKKSPTSFSATYQSYELLWIILQHTSEFPHFSFLLKELVALTRVGPEVSCEGIPSSTGIATERTFERLLSRV